MDIPTFKDLQGDVWTLRITTSDVERVRTHVVNKEGKAVDLLDMAEHGDFSTLTSDIRIFPTVVFWLVYEQLADRFSVEAYDKTHESEYLLNPEAKNKTTIQKAADWFGSRLGGDQIAEMAEAFTVALLNFIDPKVRQKIQAVVEKQKQFNEAILDKAEKETIRQLSAGLEKLSSNVLPSSESTPASGV